jgi:branched-chain amino acid transport system permease protein
MIPSLKTDTDSIRIAKKDKKNKYILIGTCIVIIGLILANFFLNGYYLRLVNLVGINIILVVSLNITNGFVGIFSLGHAAFMAIGAYTTAILSYPLERKQFIFMEMPEWLLNIHVPFFISIVLGGILAVCFAFILGYPVLKLRGHYLAVATLGFMIIVSVFASNLREITRGKSGINALPEYTNIWWVYIVAAITIYVAWRLLNSSYGRGMLAIREDDLAAEAVGVNILKHKMLAFCIGAFFAAIGGSLYGHLISAINPNMFSYSMTFGLVVMLVVGGMGSISGAILGSVLITLIPELILNKLERGVEIFGFQFPQMYGISQVIMSVALIIILIIRPKGLLGKTS